MALRVVESEPNINSFTPLAQHHAQTPGTFFDAKPILYHHSKDVEVLVAHDEIELDSAIAKLAGPVSINTTTNGDSSARTQASIKGINVFVSSEDLILYNPTLRTGVSIPYPSIALHAIQTLEAPTAREALYMQLSLSDTYLANSEDDYKMLELSIVPSKASLSGSEADTSALDAPATSARGGSNSRTPTRILFKAVSDCADLHPDPEEGEEEDAEQAPGAGGWITAENADQYFDENGQFVGQQFLGPGAGTVRGRDEENEETGTNGAEQGDAVDGDAKWRRTD